MLYDLSKPLDLSRLQAKIAADVKVGRIVLYERKTLRTKRQNNYLHFLLGAVAVETGNTMAYVKQEYFKAVANPSIFAVEKKDALIGETRVVMRSSRELTTEEMNAAIDRFKRWAAENGIYLPEPEDEARLREIALEMDRCSRFL